MKAVSGRPLQKRVRKRVIDHVAFRVLDELEPPRTLMTGGGTNRPLFVGPLHLDRDGTRF
jgi:hypothetical protein